MIQGTSLPAFKLCVKKGTPAFTVTRLQETTTVMTCLDIQRKNVIRRHTAVDITTSCFMRLGLLCTLISAYPTGDHLELGFLLC